MINHLECMNLFLFDGGAASGGGGAMAGAGEGMTGEGNTGMDAASQRAEEQPADAAQNTQRDLKAEWNKMKNGEFKQFVDEHTQNIINRRFGEMKTLQESNQKWQTIGDKLAAKYGLEGADTDAIMKAIDGDARFFQEQADKHGMTTEDYAKYSEALQYKARQQQLLTAQQKQQENARWIQSKEMEAQQLQQKYPGFNLETELQNQHFARMIQMDMPMEMAYTAVHHAELMQNGMQYAMQETQKAVTDNIQARGMRPKEGAARGNGAIVQRMTAKDLTPKELNDYNRRLLAGENPQYEDYVKRR